MNKKPMLLLVLLSMNHFLNAETTLPKNITIIFSGPWGMASSMIFNNHKQDYNITQNIEVPLYKIKYHSNGSIKNSSHLTSHLFLESRNGKLISKSVFNHGNKIVTFGKIAEQHQTSIIGNSFDSISLPWEISFNPDLVLDTFQITTGKNIYLLNSGKTSINSIKSNAKISTIRGELPIQLYDLKKIKGSSIPIEIGYSQKYRNLPVYIRFKNNVYNVEYTVKSIVVDGKKIF